MEDVLQVYEKPYCPQEPAICLDEKSVTLHEEVRAPLPMKPGRLLWRDSEDNRRGTANAFCAVEPKAGRHFTKITPTRASPEFADFLRGVVSHYPAAKTIHLVLDNLSPHTRKALVDRLGEDRGGRLWGHLAVHYTPRHGSWLNQAEIEIGLYVRQCLGKRRFGNISTLRKHTRAWNRTVSFDDEGI